MTIENVIQVIKDTEVATNNAFSASPYLKYAVAADWTAISAYAIVLIITLILYSSKKEKERAYNVALVIVSIASKKVRNVLYKNISYHKKLKIPMYLVIDEGAELQEDLSKNKDINLVIVPKSFRHDLFGKGRALRYFVENFVKPDFWYVFLDDDNLILNNTFLYEIPYYEKKGYVAFNPVLLPRKGKSYMAYIMDFARYLDDISFFRFFTGLIKKPYVGLHGELLGVKGSFLLEVNAFNKPSKVEDFLFSIDVVKNNGKTWQSNTKVSILSPNSIKDLIKQRARWYSGMTEDSRYAPITMRIIIAVKTFSRTLGLIGLWILLPFVNYYVVALILIPSSLVYWLVYIYGVKKSGKFRYIITLPIFGLLEGFGLIYGLTRIGKREFIVIDKTI
ncbi:MAG: egghead-like protein [Caldisphaera sp.]|nr:MAG: egghead-like protein [Caldisphaera sp.]PMP89071.1 MAG: egghead-like protein [Caldisphaera sp.]